MTESTQIPTLTLPSGGTVEFIDLDDLTGADVHALRRGIKQAEGEGQVSNNLYSTAMQIAIKGWDIPYLADPRPPLMNQSAWKKLRARDLRAIEHALEPVLKLARPSAADDDGSPGSPPQPDSE